RRESSPSSMCCAACDVHNLNVACGPQQAGGQRPAAAVKIPHGVHISVQPVGNPAGVIGAGRDVGLPERIHRHLPSHAEVGVSHLAFTIEHPAFPAPAGLFKLHNRVLTVSTDANHNLAAWAWVET